MKRITVFCGSNSGTNNLYQEQAYALGKELAKRRIGLVYGGANTGLMGAVANGALDNNGEVIGVLPHFLMQKEIAHNGLTELIAVETMHERKLKMNDLCDGVITLPGGLGTLEEFFEMFTWAQMGLHQKPVAILNVDGFFNSLLDFINTSTEKGFLKEIDSKRLLLSDNIEDLISQMENFTLPTVGKWIQREQT
jgi:uncharacterized protein (TIGR00730 family)